MNQELNISYFHVILILIYGMHMENCLNAIGLIVLMTFIWLHIKKHLKSMVSNLF